MTLEELQLVIDVDTSQFKKEIKTVQSEIKDVASIVNNQVNSIKNIFSGLGKFVSSLKIGEIFKGNLSSIVKSMSSGNLFSTVLVGITDEIGKWTSELEDKLGTLDLGLDNMIDINKIKEIASKLISVFKEITDFISKYKIIILAIVGALASGIIGAFLAANWEEVTNVLDILIPIVGGIVSVFASLKLMENYTKIIDGLKDAFSTLSKAIFGISWPTLLIAALIGLVVGSVLYLWRTNEDFRNSVIEIWNSVYDFISKVVTDIATICMEWWSVYGQPIIDGLLGLVQSIQDIVLAAWESFLEPLIQNILEMINWLWDEHLKGLVQQIGDFVGKFIEAILRIWNDLLAPFIEWIIDVLGPVLSNFWSLIVDNFGSAVARISDICSGVFKILSGVIDFLTGMFTNDWEKAWRGIVQIVEGIFGTLGGIVKYPINKIIDAVNWMIRGINSISFTLPDWGWLPDDLQGASFGINISPIPKLAKGGIINSATLAVVGERGREAVMPLENNTGWITDLADKVTLRMSQGSSNSNYDRPIEFVLKVGDSNFARIVVDSLNKLFQQEGKILLDL